MMSAARQQMVRLGYSVPAGLAVDVPIKHLAITGQTQEAGKTTALEALIARSGFKALTFITKRGEGSFTEARRIGPYFRERADWQFVASILEASRGEKLKFERAWIIRASKGARTLADVHRNVQRAMEKATGMSADVYLCLDAYLEVVVPEISRIRWAPGLDLAPGVNAMDLTGVTLEMQHLVIRSSLDWVLTREQGTVVVVPEAWKFIPQGRGTPVKLAAEAFVRQAAALHNFLWLDSQDLGGIDKTILRSVPLWILGVQREANEIARTLDNIPAGVAKPKPADIATLELGQFYACWGRAAVKTYAQPLWVDDTLAHEVACGRVSVATVRPLAPVVARQRGPGDAKEESVTNEEADRLRCENDQLRLDNTELRRRVETLEKGHHDVSPAGQPAHRVGDSERRPGARGGAELTDALPVAAHAGSRDARPGPTTDTPDVSPPGHSPPVTRDHSLDDEARYQAIKARLIADAPALLKVLAGRPEIEITLERRVLTADGESLRGRIARLWAKGFFDQAQTTSSVLAELSRRGFNTAPPNVSRELGELTLMGFFTRDNKWYRAVPEMKVHVLER